MQSLPHIPAQFKPADVFKNLAQIANSRMHICTMYDGMINDECKR
jgi:hypothetical protein